MRPGHISAGFDVPRPQWIDRVAKASLGASVCVIRSASGQGKTTLALRYAFDHWPRGDTWLLRSCSTAEQAEKVRRWLRFRCKLGLPTLLICEGDADCRQWTLVAEECGALRVPMLVAVRREDWVRYAGSSRFNYEIVDPELTLDEARGIYARLRGARRLHPDAPPPEPAFERVGRAGEPPLLMEYVHLLTQGRTLAERLDDQIRQVSRLGEDPAKLAIIRVATVAHGLGVTVDPSRLRDVVTFRDDPQQVLDSVNGEFVSASAGHLTGFHHVRSEKLRDLVHGPAATQTSTALDVLRLIGNDQVRAFAAVGLADAHIDAARLLDRLTDRGRAGGIALLLPLLAGCFEAGERRFLAANASVFDEAVRGGGASSATLLAGELLPITPTAVIRSLAGPIDKPNGFNHLAVLLDRVNIEAPRGLSICRQLLDRMHQHGDLAQMIARGSPHNVGHLLDWLLLCDVGLPQPESLLSELFGEPVLDLALDDLCELAQAAGRIAPAWFTMWLRDHEADFLGYVSLHLDCTTVRFVWDEQPPAVEATFIPDGAETPHEETMRRVNALRQLLPHFGRFACRGDWSLVPMGNSLPLLSEADGTVKNIPAKDLPLPSDLAKNVVFLRLVEARFTADTYYGFELPWYDLRAAAIDWCERLDRILRDWLDLRNKELVRAYPSFVASSKRLAELLFRFPPQPPPQFPAPLRQAFSALHKPRAEGGDWAKCLNNLLRQCLGLIDAKEDRHAARLAAVNATEAGQALPGVHAAFEALSGIGPTYFDFQHQADDERRVWTSLKESILLAAARRRGIGGRSLAETRRLLRDRQRLAVEEHMAKLVLDSANAGAVLLDAPAITQLPGMYDDLWPAERDNLLTTFPVIFAVGDALDFDIELRNVLDALRGRHGLADCFALIPVLAGKPLLGTKCLMIYSHRLLDDGADLVANLLPLALPDELRRLVPLASECVQSAQFVALSLVQVLTATVESFHRMKSAFAENPVVGRFADSVRMSCERQLAQRHSRISELVLKAREEADRINAEGDERLALELRASIEELLATMR